MTAFLNETEYQSLIEEVRQGRSQLTVTRNMSRQFFTHVGSSNVRDLTGQSVMTQKLIVLSGLALSILIMLATLALVAINFGWIAIVAIPLVGISWTVLAAFTTELGSFAASVVISISALGLAWFLPADYGQPLALFTASMFLYHAGHTLAQGFLLKLVTASYSAFDMLAEHIEIIRHAD